VVVIEHTEGAEAAPEAPVLSLTPRFSEVSGAASGSSTVLTVSVFGGAQAQKETVKTVPTHGLAQHNLLKQGVNESSGLIRASLLRLLQLFGFGFTIQRFLPSFDSHDPHHVRVRREGTGGVSRACKRVDVPKAATSAGVPVLSSGSVPES